MIDPVRKEALQVLAELSEVVPEVRLGQLMANLSYLARGLSNESIWDRPPCRNTTMTCLALGAK